MELQRAEYRLLCRATQEAVRLAADGDPAAGYECLIDGLCRVSEYAAEGARWAADLAADYRAALASFLRMYPEAASGAPAGPPPPREVLPDPRFRPPRRPAL